MTNKIKLFDPVIGSEEKKALLDVLHSKFWASGSGMGHVSTFEKKFKNYIKSNACIAVNSGTAALNLALSLFDIKNKEVILPSLSFVSTAHAIIENNGIPVFVDVDPISLCISPENIESAISKNTSLILPVHFGGMPCDLEKISKIAKKHNLNLSQMSLKFCEIQPFITSVIIGATGMEQLKTDIESVNINLTEEIIKEINEVQITYPNPCP